MERAEKRGKCLFRAKRRLITSSEIMKMNSAPKENVPTTPEDPPIMVEKPAEHEPVQEPLELCAIASNEEDDLNDTSGKVENMSLTKEQSQTTLQARSGTSSGYVSYSSCGSSKTLGKSKSLRGALKGEDVINLKIQVVNLRNNFGVLKLLLSQLSFDLQSTEPPFRSSASMSPIRSDGFSPDIIEYGIRLAYLDILSPKQSVLVDNNWFRGIEHVIVHLFRYGVVSEKSIQYSSGVARCFRVLALIAAEIPRVTDLIFKLLELTMRKKVPTASGVHREYMAWQTSLLCKNCPRLALKLVKTLVSEFAAILVSLHQNPENYAFHRSVTFFLSNLILDILLQLPKGCGRALKNIADDLRNIPTNAHLLSLAKQDIMDHVDFKLQPYTR